MKFSINAILAITAFSTTALSAPAPGVDSTNIATNCGWAKRDLDARIALAEPLFETREAAAAFAEEVTKRAAPCKRGVDSTNIATNCGWAKRDIDARLALAEPLFETREAAVEFAAEVNERAAPCKVKARGVDSTNIATNCGWAKRDLDARLALAGPLFESREAAAEFAAEVTSRAAPCKLKARGVDSTNIATNCGWAKRDIDARVAIAETLFETREAAAEFAAEITKRSAEKQC
jgi:hypothetical protein